MVRVGAGKLDIQNFSSLKFLLPGLRYWGATEQKVALRHENHL